ncbi:FMN-dependent NADH-azoreductase [Shewanella sp. HL-SH4]|uniref:FMN-dependent NADH-azoreductase n=1 Tax=Shewanella sp. HL-SH4 TaxID=3436240 RepID=UPI003EB6B273
MNKVLMLKSSILGEHSQSSVLLDDLAMLFKDKGAAITTRDLALDPVPVLDGELANGLRGGDNLSLRQLDALALSDKLVAELQHNDTIVLAAPMYNFMIPTQLKAWIDFIARAGVTFTYTDKGPQGLLIGKKAVIVASSGGMHKDAGSNHVVPYLTTVLAFIGITDVEVIYAEGLNMGADIAASAMTNAKQALKAISL